MAKTAAYTESCPSCSGENELPFVFCRHCGVPRVKMSRWRVTYSLTLVLVIFLGSFYFRDQMAWNAPLFLLLYIFLTQFSVSLVRGKWSHATRFNLWYSIFLLLALGSFWIFREGHLDSVFSLVSDLPEFIVDEPMVFAGTLGGLVLLFAGPMYVRWGKIYGWVNAYRIVVLTLIGIGGTLLVALRTAQWMHDKEIVEFMTTRAVTDFLQERKHLLERYLTLLTISLVRVFGFEIVIFSAVRGYAQVRKLPAITAPADLSNESGFTRSLYHIALVVRRAAQMLENMVSYLLTTLWALLKDIMQVVLAFLRELLFPTIAMIGCAFLLYRLTDLTEAYVQGSNIRHVVEMTALVGGVFLCSMVFCACKAPFRIGRVLAFYGQMLGWLLPNLLIYFLLVSFCLYATSAATSYFTDGEHNLPFRIGLLTKGAAALLALLVIGILVKKRSLFLAKPKLEAQAEIIAPEESIDLTVHPKIDQHIEQPQDMKEVNGMWLSADEPTPAKPGVFSESMKKTKEALADKAKKAGEALQLEKRTQQARESLKGLKGYLEGRPEVVEKIEKIESDLSQRKGQLRALAAMEGSVSQQTIEQLRSQYQQDISRQEAELVRLLVERERQVAEYRSMKGHLDVEHAALQKQLDELRLLQQAGAVNQSDSAKREKELLKKLASMEAQIQTCNKMLGFLMPQSAQSESASSETA